MDAVKETIQTETPTTISTNGASSNGASAPISNNGTAPSEMLQVHPMDQYNQKLVNNAHPPDWVNPVPDGPYNLLVIGAGSGGLVAAIGGIGLGGKVAIVEKNLIGGDCLNVGCVPSKAVIRPAKAIGEIMKAREMGIDVPEIRPDFGKIMERMRRIRSEISEEESAPHISELGADVFIGDGQFTGPNTFEVGGRTIEFVKAVIATGSGPAAIPIPGLAEAGYLTNVTLFEQTELPESIAVIGSGPIGSEMAQTLRRFGAEVTMLEIADRIMIREDADAARVVMNQFRKEGIDIKTEVQIKEITVNDAGDKVVHYEQHGEMRELAIKQILLAVGRKPHIDTLNLEAAGVEYHRRGITVDDTLQSTNPDIYAAGDVASKYQFTHAADATARIVIQNALFPGPKKRASSLVMPWCTYTSPEVAHVGMYEHDAKEKGIEVQTITKSIGDIDRGKTDGELDGFVKVHIKKGTDKILGATIVASHAGEMINELSLAINAGIGLKTIANVIHPYPTQAEAIKKVADEYNRSRLTPTLKNVVTWWMNRARNQKVKAMKAIA